MDFLNMDLTEKDKEKEAFIQNWERLNSFLNSGFVTSRTLAVLISLELRDKARTQILYRLHCRYAALKRRAEWATIVAAAER